MQNHNQSTLVAPAVHREGRVGVSAGHSAAAVLRPSDAAPQDHQRDLVYIVARRVMDVSIAALGLILAAPLLLVAAVAIKLSSPGPLLFRQQRAGRHRVPFTMYKLRTMYKDADDDKGFYRGLNSLPAGPCFKIKNDPRITAIGRLLRRTSIDELPQLFNVLKGEMALVGPRPIPLDEVRTDTAPQRIRFTVKPGLTCLWQVCGRTEIPYAEWLALDVWYVRHRSLSLDLQILAKTIPAVVSCRGAY